MTSDITKRQRTVPTTKIFDFQWCRNVSTDLKEGGYFDVYDDELGALEIHCHVIVDENGFFLTWKSEKSDSVVYDMSLISDVRQGVKIKDEKVLGQLQEYKGTLNFEEKTLLVTISSDFVNLHSVYLIGKEGSIINKWVNGIRALIHNSKAANICPMIQLRKHWLRLTLSVNANNKIPIKLITKTFASGKNEKMIFQSLKDLNLPADKNADVDKSQFTFEKFYSLLNMVCPRTDIQDLFNTLSNGKDSILPEKMLKFLNETQRDPRLNEILYPYSNKNTVQSIIDSYECNSQKKEKGEISVDCFYRYLLSDENAPVFLDRLDLHQDMDQPLSHYYINSSHNTYLTGRQFRGKSSVEIYRQVLLAGCRCVELDCWDGKGEDQEPIITHGKAMCSDILFKDVLVAIRDTAFVTSSYPVFLSFENHCSKPQQYKIAKYCEDIFGEYLLTKPIDKYPLEPGIPLPSPEKLKYKILLKNKRLLPDTEKIQMDMFLKGQTDLSIDQDIAEDPDLIVGEEGALNDISSSDDDDDDAEAEAEINRLKSYEINVDKQPRYSFSNSVPTTPEINAANLESSTNNTKTKNENISSRSQSIRLSSNKQSSEQGQVFKNKRTLIEKKNSNKDLSLLIAQDDALDSDKSEMATNRYVGATTNVHPCLSSLVNYAQPVKFNGFNVSQDKKCSFHMSSFSETAALAHMKNEAIELVNYNKFQMSRIYPRGNRVDSSNFLPQIFWNAGCQMVALNFQTPDLAMQLNQGKFEYNNNSGYLLKPEFMRRPEKSFDPFSESPMDGVIAATCEVKILSGQFLSDKKVGTFVEVDMYGLPTDTIRKEFRTRVVPGNGLNPLYPEDSNFVFRKVILPDLAVLRIAVFEETSKLIGQRVLPLDGLQTGYRHISLRSEANFPCALASLFCKITLSTYVPDGFASFVDALSDPRAHISREEQRLKQMANMGFETSDIRDIEPTSSSFSNKKPNKKELSRRMSSENAESVSKHISIYDKNNKTSTPSKGKGENFVCSPNKSIDVKDESIFEDVTPESLNETKTMKKIIKKCQRDIENLEKRQNKEMLDLMKSHSSSCERLENIIEKQKRKVEGNNNLQVSHKFNQEVLSLTDKNQKEKIKVAKNHLSTLENLHNSQMIQLKESYQKVLNQLQLGQRKYLRLLQKREVKEMQNQQTKSSIEANKSVLNDSNFRNKAERDRRLRELCDYNAKRFLDQRRAQQIKHSRQTEILEQRHEEQLLKLNEFLEKKKRTIFEEIAKKRTALDYQSAM